MPKPTGMGDHLILVSFRACRSREPNRSRFWNRRLEWWNEDFGIARNCRVDSRVSVFFGWRQRHCDSKLEDMRTRPRAKTVDGVAIVTAPGTDGLSEEGPQLLNGGLVGDSSHLVIAGHLCRHAGSRGSATERKDIKMCNKEDMTQVTGFNQASYSASRVFCSQ